MPHDMHGNQLEVGDSVVLQGTIKSIDSQSETMCNVTVEILQAEGEYQPSVALNSRSAQATADLPTCDPPENP